MKIQINLREMVKFRKHRLWVRMKERHKQKMWRRICKKKKNIQEKKGVLDTIVSFDTEGKKIYKVNLRVRHEENLCNVN